LGDEREPLRTGFGFGTEWNVEAVTALQIFLKKNGAADLEITQRMGLDGNALFGVCDKDPTIMALQAFLNRQLVPGAPIPAGPAAARSAANQECALPVTSGAFAAALAAAVAVGPPSAAHPLASAMLSIEDPPQVLGLRDGETRTLGRQHMSPDDPACKMLSREQVIFTFVGGVLRATKIGKAHSCLGSEPGRNLPNNLPMNESIELKDGDTYYLHYSPERGPIFGVTVSIAPAKQEGWQACSGEAQASRTASSSRSGMGCSSCTCTSGEAQASPTASSSRSAALKRARAAAAASSRLQSPEPPAPTLFKRWTLPKSPPAPQPQLPPPQPPQRTEATPETASGTPPSEEAIAPPPRAFEYEPGAMARMQTRLESSRLAQVVASPVASGHEEPTSPLKSAFRWLQQLQDLSQGPNDEGMRAAPTDMDLDLWI